VRGKEVCDAAVVAGPEAQAQSQAGPEAGRTRLRLSRDLAASARADNKFFDVPPSSSLSLAEDVRLLLITRDLKHPPALVGSQPLGVRARARTALTRALVVVVVIVCACSPDDRPRRAHSTPSESPQPITTAVASTLVLTHSWSGRTALVGRTWAEMLGARYLRFGDAPDGYSSVGAQGLTAEQIRPQLDLDTVQRIYLGFPIWKLGPAPPAWQLLTGLDLSGIQIVPFFTYLHHVNDDAMAGLVQRLRGLGADVLEPIEIRVPASFNPTQLARRAHEALLKRPDLWSSKSTADVSCSSEGAPSGHTLCTVPAGAVWLGDDGSEDSPPGSVPPRRLSVAAFEIDRAEVTIAQYDDCVQAGKCSEITLFDPCGRLMGDGDNRPMPCVSLEAARGYCAAVGMRMPDEAEWTRAARGDSAAPYPWGFSAPGTDGIARGNFGEKRGAGMPEYSLVEPGRDWPADGATRLAVGCSYPRGNSPFGVCDLAGNIGEWVEPASGAPGPMFKGGTWMDPDPATFRIASRGLMSLDRAVSSVGYYLTGFRCARSVAP